MQLYFHSYIEYQSISSVNVLGVSVCLVDRGGNAGDSGKMEYAECLSKDNWCNVATYWGLSILVGGFQIGFNSFETYESNWIVSPGRGENRNYLKPPPSIVCPP